MKPSQPNTKLTRSSQRPPSRQTCQQPPIVITIDDSSTESNNSSTESESYEAYSPLESDPDDYMGPENQLGFTEWERRRLEGLPEVAEVAEVADLADKIDCGVQVSQNEPVGKDDIPADGEKPEIFSSSDGQNQVKIKMNSTDTHHSINMSFKLRMRGMKRKLELEVEYVGGGEQVKRQKGSSIYVD